MASTRFWHGFADMHLVKDAELAFRSGEGVWLEAVDGRRFLEEHGMSAATADRAAIAIILHMQPAVTSADGVEALLLDRATGVDVRGAEYQVIDGVRTSVLRKYPRGHFDRHFLRAIRREVAVRPTCQSARLLNENDLEGTMARSPWATPR